MHSDFTEGWHIPIIAAVVAAYAKPVYVEIGVRDGRCLNQIAKVSEAHGVDPADCAECVIGARFWHMRSDEFFEQFERPIDVAFIDGDHSREQVARDFWNVVQRLSEDGTVFLHDTWPVHPQYERDTGTGYHFAEHLELGPFNVFTFRRWPGLTLVQRPRIERF